MRIRRRYGECGAGDRLCVSVAHAQGTFAKLLRNLRCCCAKERKESCAEKTKVWYRPSLCTGLCPCCLSPLPGYVAECRCCFFLYIFIWFAKVRGKSECATPLQS